jgi:hypothetical protein
VSKIQCILTADVEIEGVGLRATTDQDGNETLVVELTVMGETFEVIRERGGIVARQDQGANVSTYVSAAGIWEKYPETP